LKPKLLDIFRMDTSGGAIWVETAPDLQIAKSRVEALGAIQPGEYLVFDPRTGRKTLLRAPNFLPGAHSDVRFEEIVATAVALMRSDYGSLQMLYPERGTGGELRLLGFRGFNPHAARFWEWVRADSKSTCGIALTDARRVVAPDIANCDFMADSEDQRVYLQTGIRACQTTPLIAHAGNVVGMLSTHWRTPHQPSEQDFREFDLLAKQAADLIECCNR
jgi:GAF domain-containing protein